jgi:hypothetical protein
MDKYELLKKWALNIKADGASSDEWGRLSSWAEQRHVAPDMQKLKYNNTQYYIIVGSCIAVVSVISYVMYLVNYKPKEEGVIDDEEIEEVVDV